MMDEFIKHINIWQFQEDLLTWYDKNKRELPWREDSDPYKVWVSEIMLQQTKVDTVIPYFERFIRKFPSPYELAAASQEEVLKMWEGLGYYSRAKNLHEAVKEVVEKYDGNVPDDAEKLGTLKGVGPYTKGAILSIAFNKPEPAIDGNVLRVFSRLFKVEDDISKGPVKKRIESYVKELISEEDPSSFNQAIMDLGATICTPKSPQCLLCPVNKHCLGFEEGVQEQLPVKKKAKKQKTVSYVALIMKEKDRVIIEKRPSEGLLADLWQFPMVPIEEVGMNHIEHWFYGEYGVEIHLQEKLGNIRHVFSHLIWDIDVYEAKIIQNENNDTRIRMVKTDSIDDFPFPVSHQKMKAWI
ncbi:adenine DNA glycosylase [Compostibacillus humi]|uniref:Adenine DNA glycosylase n=2 Tax=Compostibacillus humi TaxID=1245525 RepID=A0A8J2TUU7_9BACI|nr:adenine DNA glycosylase [Compostibacillus humi]